MTFSFIMNRSQPAVHRTLDTLNHSVLFPGAVRPLDLAICPVVHNRLDNRKCWGKIRLGKQQGISR